MKQKTIKQWLNTLPEPLKSEALKTNKKYGQVWQDYNNYLSSAILNGFWWDKAESGEDFWYSLYRALLEAENEI